MTYTVHECGACTIFRDSETSTRGWMTLDHPDDRFLRLVVHVDVWPPDPGAVELIVFHIFRDSYLNKSQAYDVLHRGARHWQDCWRLRYVPLSLGEGGSVEYTDWRAWLRVPLLRDGDVH